MSLLQLDQEAAEQSLRQLLEGNDPEGRVAARLRYWFVADGDPIGNQNEKELAKKVLARLENMRAAMPADGVVLYSGNSTLKAARKPHKVDKWLPASAFGMWDIGTPTYNSALTLNGLPPHIVLWDDWYWADQELDRKATLFHELTHLFLETEDYAPLEYESTTGAYTWWVANRASQTDAQLLDNADSYTGFIVYGGLLGHP
jgi:hypothetical protein